MVSDMIFVYKMLHNVCDNKLEDVGFSLSSGNDRNGKQKLYQHRARNRQSGTFSNTECLHYGKNCRHVYLLLRR